MEVQGCCKSGDRDRACKEFGITHKDKTLPEKIEALKAERLHNQGIYYVFPPTLNADGTLTNAKKDGFAQILIDMAWIDPKCKLFSLVGVCGKESPITTPTFDYFMGVRFDREIPKDMEELIIPSSIYVVFPNTLDGWKNYKEWLSTSEYELSGLPFIEHFLGPGHKVKHELWIPIKKRADII